MGLSRCLCWSCEEFASLPAEAASCKSRPEAFVDPERIAFRLLSKLDAFPETPSIFVGGKRHFYNQHNDADWKEKYIHARHDCFGARGSKDETCGNSTYQIRFVRLVVEVHKVSGRIVPCNMYEFGVTNKGKKLGTFLLNEKESRKLRDCLSNNTALKVFAGAR